MEYSFGHSKHLLETDDFGLEFQNALMQFGKSAALLRHMYWIFQFVHRLPEWLAVLMSPGLGLLFQTQQVWVSQHFSIPFTRRHEAKPLYYADYGERDY